MGLKTTGLGSVIKRLRQLSDIADDAVNDALLTVAFEVLREAKKRTPVDTGFLRSSGQVDLSGANIVIRFTAKYALPVHERMDVEHPVGEAKFLENAFELVVEDSAQDILIDRLSNVMGT